MQTSLISGKLNQYKVDIYNNVSYICSDKLIRN